MAPVRFGNQDKAIGYDEDDAFERSIPTIGPVSPQQLELLNIFNIPYPVDILSRDGNLINLPAQQAAAQLSRAHTVAAGDLHGSFLKLLEVLVMGNFIRLSPDDARYLVSARHYIDSILTDDPWLTKKSIHEKTIASPNADSTDTPTHRRSRRSNLEDMRLAYHHLQSVIKRIEWIGNDRQLILTGDIIADRGPLDLITLDILKQLNPRTRDKRIIWLVGNHDASVLDYIWEGHQTGDLQDLGRNRAGLLNPTEPEQQGSMLRSFRVTDNPNKLIEDYLTFLYYAKLMHYDQANKALYTHAPMDGENWTALETDLQNIDPTAYRAARRQGLSAVATFANKVYASYIQYFSDQIDPPEQPKRLIKRKSLATEAEKKAKWIASQVELILDTHRGTGFLWLRDGLNEFKQLATDLIRSGEIETMIHGHDGRSKNSPFVITQPPDPEAEPYDFCIVNLDQAIRKEVDPSLGVPFGVNVPKQESCPIFIE